jgi:hypothetical protein
MPDIDPSNTFIGSESPASRQANDANAESGQRPSLTVERSSGSAGKQPSRGRWIGAVILLVIGCLLAPIALSATWARNVVLDTNTYVSTVAPLAADPTVQDGIATAITARIFAHTDARHKIQDALPAKAAFLAAPLVGQLQTYVEKGVSAVVATSQFQKIWEQANRRAHQAVVHLLTGRKDAAITVSEGTVTLNLAPLIDRIKARLDQSGLTAFDRALSGVDGQIAIYHSDRLAKAGDVLTRARNAVDLLQQWAFVLVALTLVALGAAIVLAPERRAAVLWAGLGVALAMLVLAIGLAIGRSAFLDALNGTAFPRDAAAAVFDIVIQPLRDGLRAFLVLGLVVAGGAALAGPSHTAVRLRESIRHLGDETATTRWGSGSLATWVAHHRQTLDIGAIAIGALVLVWWGQPTVGVIIFLSALVLVGVICIEVLSRAGQVTATH